jgi:predicted methyltransferase
MRTITIAAALWFTASLIAQVAKDANSGYQTPEQRKTVAKTLANPERDKTQRPGQLVRQMSIAPGMTVADLGTGIGYMLPFLSRAVGANG